MNQPDLQLVDLRYFVHAAAAGSFVAGATLASISPAAMSKAMRRLEESLGVRLFDRTTRRVTLTEAGTLVLERSERLLREARAVRSDLAGLAGEVGGELRVGAMEVFSIELLPDAVSALIAAHPRVEPRLHELIPEQQVRYLADGLIDVGFTIGAVSSAAVNVERLGSSRGCLVCGPTHPLYAGGNATAADLLDFPSVAPRFLGKEYLPVLDQFPEGQVPRRVGATIELLQMAVRLALNGTYLGYFPEVSIGALLADGRLRALTSPASDAPPFELQALTRQGATPRRAAVRLIDEVRARVDRAQEPGSG